MLKFIVGQANIEYKDFFQWVENDAVHGNLDMLLDCRMESQVCRSEEEIEAYKAEVDELGKKVLAEYGAKKRWFGLRGTWDKYLRLAAPSIHVENIISEWTPAKAMKNLNAEEYKAYLEETGLASVPTSI